VQRDPVKYVLSAGDNDCTKALGRKRSLLCVPRFQVFQCKNPPHDFSKKGRARFQQRQARGLLTLQSIWKKPPGSARALDAIIYLEKAPRNCVQVIQVMQSLISILWKSRVHCTICIYIYVHIWKSIYIYLEITSSLGLLNLCVRVRETQ